MYSAGTHVHNNAIGKFRRDCPQWVKSGIYLVPVTNSSKRNHSTVNAGLRRLRDPEAHAKYLFRKLSRLLRANRSAPNAETVHQLRTTVRRIQTLATSLGEQDSKAFGKFDKLLVEIFEKAGKVRDLDVQLEALNTISLLPSVEDDKALLQNYLQRQRAKRQRKLTTTVQEELIKRLPKRQRRAKALLLKAANQPLNSETRRTIDLHKEVLPFVEKLHSSHFDAETLHELRLEVKHVRYAAEAAGDVGAEMVALLKPVQDAIGGWHDWWTLVETADRVLGPLPGHPLMTILRSKMRARFTTSIAALKPLEARLSDTLELGEQKRPGPMLVRQELAAAANAS